MMLMVGGQAVSSGGMKRVTVLADRAARNAGGVRGWVRELVSWKVGMWKLGREGDVICLTMLRVVM